jgi:hypothetical protein
MYGVLVGFEVITVYILRVCFMWPFGLWASGLLQHIILYVDTDVSEEHGHPSSGLNYVG